MDSFGHTLPGKIWGSWRFVMYKLVEHKYFETFIILMILASSMALVRSRVFSLSSTQCSFIYFNFSVSVAELAETGEFKPEKRHTAYKG